MNGHAEPRLEVTYRVRFDECGASGTLRSSTFLRWAQEVAWLHSEAAGFDRAWYRERGVTWLVRCVELDVLGAVGPGDSVRVTTEILGTRRVWARRRSEFVGEEDERPRAYAIIDWVLIGREGKPARVPREIDEVFGAPFATFTPARVDLDGSPSTTAPLRFRVRAQDLDPMAHVNNAVYVDYLEEGVGAAGGGEDVARLPRRYRLEYLAAAAAEAALVGTAWDDELGWAYRLSGDDGRELLRARLETDPGAWVGG